MKSVAVGFALPMVRAYPSSAMLPPLQNDYEVSLSGSGRYVPSWFRNESRNFGKCTKLTCKGIP